MKKEMLRNEFVLKILFILILTGLYSSSLLACTVIYMSKNEEVFGGNNEDWKDPYSKMFIYPPVNDKNGWVKFGWGSGFPQGGMNDKGLFWDGTSATHLPMPVSEANKEHLSGPIMKKIIEECNNIDEAKQVFDEYYCEDQYRAQYLVGDKYGKSIIVEGDGSIENEAGYQVLTNFYQSQYSEGQYPCSRYNTANEMLQNVENLDVYKIGFVLGETFQSGSYPTQYSNIYDLKRGVIYLF